MSLKKKTFGNLHFARFIEFLKRTIFHSNGWNYCYKVNKHSRVQNGL